MERELWLALRKIPFVSSMDARGIVRVWVPLLAGAWVLGCLFASHVGPRGPARFAGLGLAIVGLTGICTARSTLGRSFSIRAKATALVTRGIYARIRNPIYISGEIFLIGIAIMLWKLIFLLVFVAVIPIQVLRARKEARVLEEKFGEEYRAYRRRTWF